MIAEGQHLDTSKIVAMDVEYGGGKTVPRVAVVGFDEKVLYYSDFCLRYEDWIETKLTQQIDDQNLPLIMYTTKGDDDGDVDGNEDKE